MLLCSSPAHEMPVAKKLTKDYVFIPAGNEGDSLLPEFYISAIEITNKQYRDFINDLIDSGATDKVKLAMVDSSQWTQHFPSQILDLEALYFRDPSYDDCPVVNISRRGADLYCDWLTEKYNQTAKLKAHFALPTELQWQYAARGGNPKAIYPWPGKSLQYEKKGKYRGTNMCNYLVEIDQTGAAHRYDSHAKPIAPSRSFLPNTYEVYNMAGNVAEMIADQNYTKGGSYLSHGDKILIDAHEDANLTHGSPMIGFRPVMIYEPVN